MDRSQIAVVIPALNEERTIANVVTKASKHARVIVVDDGSTDATAVNAKGAGATVVSHVSNKGYDAALDSGLAHAFSTGCDAVVTLDADGQHNPDLLPRFIEELQSGKKLILGVRDKKPRVAEHLFAFYTHARYKVSDPLCGLKAYHRQVYESLGHFDKSRSIGTELCLHALRAGFDVAQIRFEVADRQDLPRFGKLISANARIMRALLLDVIK